MMNLKSFGSLLLICGITISCTNSKSAPNVNLESTVINNKKDSVDYGLVDINQYKLGLLGADISKAIKILGKPDDQGQSKSGRSGHYVYYNKTVENNALRHLVIYYNYDDRYSTNQTIKTVKAVGNRGSFYEPGYGTFFITKPIKIVTRSMAENKVVNEIDKQYKALDYTKLESFTKKFYGADATFYYDSDLKLQLVKQEYTFAASRGGVRTEFYFFIANNISFISIEDNLNDLLPSKEYIYSDLVIRSTIGGKPSNCSYQCKYDKNSKPYKMLDYFNSQWGD